MLGFLVKKEKLDPVFAQKLCAWRYSGFGIHNGKVIAKDDREEQESASLASEELELIDVSDYKPPKRPTKHWRELIKKVWNIDPLLCPKCGGEMKVLALIDEPSVVKRILEHLGLWLSVCNAQFDRVVRRCLIVRLICFPASMTNMP